MCATGGQRTQRALNKRSQRSTLGQTKDTAGAVRSAKRLKSAVSGRGAGLHSTVIVAERKPGEGVSPVSPKTPLSDDLALPKAIYKEQSQSRGSDPHFFNRLYRHDPGDTFHDSLVLLSLL
jgi:hypothetical protein